MSVATAQGSAERTGVITFKGNGLTLVGPEVTVGSKAPDFTVTGQDLSPVSLAAGKGKVRIISVVPSIDTPVCDQQTRRFNQEAATLPGVEIWTISMDLPFAQKRWCGAAGIDKVKLLSDYKDAGFGTAWGTLIKELHLETRAVFVVDRNDVVQHAEYVKEVTTHPNYDAALAAARKLA